jgi:hypothetical protein
MAAEDLPREVYNREDITEEHSFDELARGLASGSISRRRALKLLGLSIGGGLLASIPGLAWGQPVPPQGKGPPEGKGPPPNVPTPECSPTDPCDEPLECCEGVCRPVEFFQTPEACGECPPHPGASICEEGQTCCCPEGRAGPGVCQCCDPTEACQIVIKDPVEGPVGVCAAAA